MTDPRRLSDEPGSALEVALLRSARNDAATPHARARMLVTLGLATSAAATATTVTTATTASAAGASVATAGAASASVVKGALVAKVVVGMMIVSAMGVGAVAYARWIEHAGKPHVAVAGRAERPSPKAIDTIEAVAAPSANASVASVVVIGTSRASASKAAPSVATAAAKSTDVSLRRELALLEAARSSLTAGNASAALVSLDAHDREFPKGALREEAEVMRIDALARVGNATAARALGESYLKAHPGSPGVKRVREVLASLGEKE